MRKINILLSLSSATLGLFTSCAPKEQIGIFDSNMLMRTTSEAEEISKQISQKKEECRSNKEEIAKNVESLKSH